MADNDSICKMYMYAGSVEVRGHHNNQRLCHVTKYVWGHFVYNSNTRSHHLTPLLVSVHMSECEEE